NGDVARQEAPNPRRGGGVQLVPVNQGLNRFDWDLRYPDATSFPGMILWAGGVRSHGGSRYLHGAFNCRRKNANAKSGGAEGPPFRYDAAGICGAIGNSNADAL